LDQNHDRIVIDDEHYADRIAAAAGVTYYDGIHDHCVARVRDGVLLGGTIYQGYTGAAIEMHVAGFDPRWICPDLLWATFSYPFIQLGCKQVIGRVAETNTRALEFDKKLGFKEVGRIREYFPDGDLIILALRRDECRWLKITPRSRFWEHPNGR
jgi:RimJ/RimL family protein N-acetyltransferase